jgi:hypothetical protein
MPGAREEVEYAILEAASEGTRRIEASVNVEWRATDLDGGEEEAEMEEGVRGSAARAVKGG